jgi:hypothetical protein
MPEHLALETTPGNLLEHPAVRAWCMLEPWRPVPRGLTTLKARRQRAIYRLEGAGPAGSAVIAKRSWKDTVPIERVVYEEVLPRLPLPVLQCYGTLEEPEESECCWLFLEDAAGEEYAPFVHGHRVAGARWLGLLHLTAEAAGRPCRLPERGPDSYFRRLDSACARLQEHVGNPALKEDERAVLKALVQFCKLLVSRWVTIEDSFHGMPQTVVHGDFVDHNIRVRRGPTETLVLPFDWETAGWGVPAADWAECSDLDAYYAVVRSAWPSLAFATLRRLAAVGRVFNWIRDVDLSSLRFTSGWVGRNMSHMTWYLSSVPGLLDVVRGGG